MKANYLFCWLNKKKVFKESSALAKFNTKEDEDGIKMFILHS